MSAGARAFTVKTSGSYRSVEEVGATVYAEPGLDVEDLRAFLQGHLAKFEVPRYVLPVTQPLPRTASGKILKRELREEAISKLL